MYFVWLFCEEHYHEHRRYEPNYIKAFKVTERLGEKYVPIFKDEWLLEIDRIDRERFEFKMAHTIMEGKIKMKTFYRRIVQRKSNLSPTHV